MASGGDLSLGSLVGFVTRLGITPRNYIMLISHYEHLVKKEGMAWGPDAAAERLVSILMTAVVAALDLLPLASASSAAGNEIEGPMAIVILGGLVTSTVLNLLVQPTVACTSAASASGRKSFRSRSRWSRDGMIWSPAPTGDFGWNGRWITGVSCFHTKDFPSRFLDVPSLADRPRSGGSVARSIGAVAVGMLS